MHFKQKQGVTMIETFDDIVDLAKKHVSSIPQIPLGTNFWMVRSKQGIFYDEFIRDRYIAIGWNILTQAVLAGDKEDEHYKQLLTQNGYPDKVPGTALNKCRRFIEEIDTGDIIMLVGKYEIAFATVGDYFELDSERTSLQKELEVHAQIESGTYHGSNCPYKKRRHISIIAKSYIESVPPAVYKCLVSNRHSLSNLNEYAIPILSCCYAISYYNGQLLINYHVQQPRDINPLDFSVFTYNAANLLADPSTKITGKYNINSAGDILLILTNEGKEAYEFIQNNLVPILLIYLATFGGKGLGFEIPSAVDKIKGWVSDFLLFKETKRIEKTKADKAELEVEKERIEIERQRIEVEQLRLLAQQNAEKVVNDIQQSAAPLNIRPPAKSIIDFEKHLQKDKIEQ